jgi:hypothetical protein
MKNDRQEELEVLFQQACNDTLPKNPELYWEIVSEVWKRIEFPHMQYEAWYEIFSQSPGPNSFTKKWLKDSKIVYRGRNKLFAYRDTDWSWTTDYQKAKWFATRFCDTPEIIVFDCSKDPSRVWCVFENDTENEVLLWSPTVADMINNLSLEVAE